jgi:maltooligosyltrehalose trehalohydrolase
MISATHRRHSMPFGAELTQAGVRFRLWAPGAQAVDVMLETGAESRALALQALPEGWFELVTTAAQAGSRYRYRIDGGLQFADPASRFNPEDAQGVSLVVDPCAFDWPDAQWRGRPWHEAVLYELHVGTFTPEGTFAGVEQRLDYLAELGVTVIELMPIADFPGRRGWGYDGVLPYAPDSAYGSPSDLKSLVAAAHARRLAVMLDVVYNHFGPEGNYLHQYAPGFFTDRHHTPWGCAINFDGPGSATVRDFFIHNALYWLEEYHFDGLRFDAVHAIIDDSDPDIFEEMARTLRAGPGKNRPIYLVLENNANHAHYLGAAGAPATHDAQWNDDVHHCLHVILTGETDGYYADYAERAHALLCRTLAEGFAYQGEVSQYQGGKVRGEPSAQLPPTAFVSFLQNHDQIGNRAHGDRLTSLVKDDAALLAAAAVLLLAPAPPMLFMGEEWGALEPFPYFCDMSPELTVKIREGRRREFARFGKFADANELPDPAAAATFEAAHLDWARHSDARHAHWLEQYRRLLTIRRRDIVPLIPAIRSGKCTLLKNNAFGVDWSLGDDAVLHLIANLTPEPAPIVGRAAGRVIFATHPDIRGAVSNNELAPWSVTWLLERGRVST